MKKKVLLVTFHAARNYGAVLQTYAMTRVLERLGCDVAVLDYRSDSFSVAFSWRHPVSWIYYWIFHRFGRRHFKQTRRYASIRELENDCPEADCYLFGSDQIWNVDNTREHRGVFFGDFVPDGSNLTAYAASFGKDDFADRAYLTARLKRFHAVSVREDAGLEICRAAGCDRAVHVLDPSLLWRDYADLMTGPAARRALTCFFLENVGEDFYQLAGEIAGELKLSPVLLNKNRPRKGFRNIAFPSVGRVLRQLSSSDFVVTNSFHGVAFAINFHREFIFVPTYRNTTSRIRSLLKSLGLEERLFLDPAEARRSQVWRKKIDYDIVESRLRLLRGNSLDFLSNALGINDECDI